MFQPVTYGIGSYHSNAMKSDNPTSGIYVADTSRTLDALNCGYPGCNQGGMAVVQPVFGIDQQGGKGGANYSVNVSPPMMSDSHGTPHAVAYQSEKYLFENHSQDARVKGPLDVAPIVSATYGMGGNNTPLVMESIAYGVTTKGNGDAFISEERHTALSTGGGKAGQGYHCIMESAQYVDTTHADDVVRVDSVTAPLQARDYKGGKLVLRHIVRRLTPLECERLQGYPDGWTDIGEWVDSKGKKHKEADSPRYKALGNSIALPPWKWVLKRLCACYERDATMASLFDGIGGFPYIWEQLNGKGSCLWASEIEEFPMAVTKLRFGG